MGTNFIQIDLQLMLNPILVAVAINNYNKKFLLLIGRNLRELNSKFAYNETVVFNKTDYPCSLVTLWLIYFFTILIAKKVECQFELPCTVK